MAIAHEHDGAHEAVEHFLKEGIMLATQYVKHHKTQALAAQHEAIRRDHELQISGRQERFQQALATRISLDRAQASLQYANVSNDEWWQRADAATIIDTYKAAATHADQDPSAAHAVEVMTDFMKAHMGIDVSELAQATETADSADWLPPDRLTETYREHLETGRGVSLDGELSGPSNRALAELEQQFTGNADIEEVLAGVRDFHLSQALTSVASPHTIDQVAATAEGDSDVPQPRRASPERELGGERDTLDR
jgi:hypothetical protein